MTVSELAELLPPIGCGPLASRTPLNNRVPSVRGFHTLWGGIEPWDRRLGPWFVGVVQIWNDF